MREAGARESGDIEVISRFWRLVGMGGLLRVVLKWAQNRVEMGRNSTVFGAWVFRVCGLRDR